MQVAATAYNRQRSIACSYLPKETSNCLTTRRKEHYLLIPAKQNLQQVHPQEQKPLPAHTCQKKPLNGLPPSAKSITCSYLPKETLSIGLPSEAKSIAQHSTLYPCLCIYVSHVSNSRQEHYRLNLVEKDSPNTPSAELTGPRSCKSSLLLQETHQHCTHILVTSKGIGGASNFELPRFHQIA